MLCDVVSLAGVLEISYDLVKKNFNENTTAAFSVDAIHIGIQLIGSGK